MRLLIVFVLLTVALTVACGTSISIDKTTDEPTAGPAKVLIPSVRLEFVHGVLRRYHDDEMGVTCWESSGSSSLYCIPDHLLTNYGR